VIRKEDMMKRLRVKVLSKVFTSSNREFYMMSNMVLSDLTRKLVHQQKILILKMK